MSDKADKKARTQMLKALREKYDASVETTREVLKNQQNVRRMIQKAITAEPKTVPQTAEEIGLPANEVLWHVMAMKKYGLVVESDMQGDYYTYQLAKES
jgi:predicted transcriptional regulator